MYRFHNKYEEITFNKMDPLCRENDAHVMSKVRLADAIPIKRSDQDFSFALCSHLDFLVISHNIPIFAVEFDGPSHNDANQRRRDAIKNSLCSRFRLPLLRINGKYLDYQYRGLDLLTYFLECWFLNSAFEKAQESGLVPWDEGFDPTFIASDGRRSGKEWPYWLSFDVQMAIKDMHKQGLVRDRIISHWVGVDSDGSYHCLSWIHVTDHRFAIARRDIRAQNFPVIESDILSQLASFDIYENVSEVLKGKRFLRTESVLLQLLEIYQKAFRMSDYLGYAGNR